MQTSAVIYTIAWIKCHVVLFVLLLCCQHFLLPCYSILCVQWFMCFWDVLFYQGYTQTGMKNVILLGEAAPYLLYSHMTAWLYFVLALISGGRWHSQTLNGKWWIEGCGHISGVKSRGRLSSEGLPRDENVHVISIQRGDSIRMACDIEVSWGRFVEVMQLVAYGWSIWELCEMLCFLNTHQLWSLIELGLLKNLDICFYYS